MKEKKLKTYHPFSFLSVFIQVLYLTGFSLSIFVLIGFCKDLNSNSYITIILISFLSLLFIYLFLRTLFVRVSFTENEIKVSQDYLFLFKYQYKFSLSYSLIEDIKLVSLHKNSKGKRLEFGHRSPGFFYIELSIKGKRNKKRINITYFSKSQLRSILKNLIDKIKIENDTFMKTADKIFYKFYPNEKNKQNLK